MSKLSSSDIFTVNPTDVSVSKATYTGSTLNYATKYATLTATVKARYDSLGVVYNGVAQTGGLVSNSPSGDGGQYYYHSDQLGSANYITDETGSVSQHLEYIPYGETFVDERYNNWHAPYVFNGKERDEETGLTYYGARYLDGNGWLSVDPLAHKYPNVGSYVYCHANPVNRIDPDGMADGDANSGGTPATEKKNGGYTSAQSSIRTVKSERYDPVKIPEGKEGAVRYSQQEKNPFVLAFTTGDGGSDPANQQTPSQWTDQDKAVGTGVVGAIVALTGITELAGVAAKGTEFILPLLGLANSIDDAGTNKNGESLAQQQTNDPKTKERISDVKGVISLAGAGNALKKPTETLKSIPQTMGGLLDAYSSGSFLNQKANSSSNSHQTNKLKPQAR